MAELHTPTRPQLASGRRVWTPSPPRRPRSMALEGWHTDKPQRTKCMREELDKIALLPAASVFQSDLASVPHDNTPLFNTPSKDSPFHKERSIPLGDVDDDSPGMARASSPSAEAHVRRDYVREALGDVSNFSSPATVYSLKDGVSPLRMQSTPLRRSIHLPPSISSTKKTPVQMALQDWAGSKFDRPLPTQDASSPYRETLHPSHKGQESRSSPINVDLDQLMANDEPVPLASARVTAEGTVPRLPVRRIAVSPQPSAQRVPGFMRAPSTGPSPAKRAVGPMRTVVSPVQPVLPEMPKSSPLPRIPSPEKAKETAGSSPCKTPRLWRPARYASQAPAVRVWDSPEKIESHKRLRPPMKPMPAPATEPEPASAAKRMSTRLQKRTAPAALDGVSVSRPQLPSTHGNPPAPASPQRVTRSDVSVPVPPTRTGNLRSRTPRTPKTPPVPPRPQLSATELARLTQRHTKHNETYMVQLDTQVERVPGPRPPSPSQHFLLGRGVRARENFQPARTETDERGQPVGHAHGAGDEDEYSTPPGKQAVRWDKRLVISPPRQSSAAHDATLPLRSCLVAKPVALDAFGNVASKPMRDGPRRRVLIKRRIYDDEEDMA